MKEIFGLLIIPLMVLGYFVLMIASYTGYRKKRLEEAAKKLAQTNQNDS